MMAFGLGMCFAKALRVAKPMPWVAPAKTAVRDSCLFLSEAFADLTSVYETIVLSWGAQNRCVQNCVVP